MPSVDYQDLAVARVYSEAMIQLAQDSGDVDLLLEELLDFVGLMDKDEDFRAFVTDPTIDLKARTRSIETLFRGKYSDLFVDALQILNAKERLALIGAVAEAYRLDHETLKNKIEVFVHTAAPLTDALREGVRRIASEHTSMEPDLVESVDESLIGGLVMRIGDEKYDASVAMRLRRLSHALHDRASRELHGDKCYFEKT